MSSINPKEVRILAIDDDDESRELLKAVLKRHGFTIIFTAANARTALDFLRHGTEEIHLILLDLDMPDMNGIAFLRALRADADEKIANLPVVVVTAHGSEKVEEGLRTLGIQGFVGKTRLADELQPAILRAL